jgi:uncharacterized protein
MLRLLSLIAFLALAALLVRMVLRAAGKGGPPPRGAVAHMVKCATCGVFVPETDALVDGDRSYCSREHLERQQNGGGA